jgi:hypothetical protein
MTGPVQVLVVGFEQPTFSGGVMAELDRLREAGTLRLIDVLLVARAEDGTFESLPAPEGAPPGLGELAARILAGSDADDADDAEGAEGADVADPADPSYGAWSLAEAVPVGTTAAVALIEHLWAVPLREAIQGAGGRALEESWLAPDDVRLLEGLLAQRDA